MWQLEHDVVEEIEWGKGMKMRLCQTHKKKNKLIQIWSSISKSWKTMYRYEVDSNWKWWKNYAELYAKRHKT